MATIHHFGPYTYQIAGRLPPGGYHNVVWWGGATVNVTGHPHRTTTGGQSAVWVSDMSIEHVPQFGGPPHVNAYATFGNSGQTILTGIQAYITVTKA